MKATEEGSRPSKKILIFPIALAVVIIGIPIAERYKLTKPHRECIRLLSIKTVGGCDWLGYCGVLLSDGTAEEVRKPVPYTLYCSEYEWSIH